MLGGGGGGGRQVKNEGRGGTFTAAAELQFVETKGGAGAGAWALGEEAAAAF
jgi:hypothetical protein